MNKGYSNMNKRLNKKKKRMKQITPPKATHLNEILRSKRSEAHEPKKGEKAKRSRRKQEERDEIEKGMG